MADIQRFIANLAIAFGAKTKAETLHLYADKLVKFQLKRSLPDSVWDRALSKLVADMERFPELSVIYKYLSGTAAVPTGGLDWMTYDLDGKRYAVRVTDWFSEPKLPPQAYNLHSVVANPRDYFKCSPAEAREGFAEGFNQAGGPPALLEQAFRSPGQRTQKREGGFEPVFGEPSRHISDYDDSPLALGQPDPEAA